VADRLRFNAGGSDSLVQEAIDAVINEHPAIEHVFNAITIQFGPDTMLALKIRLRADVDINKLERELKDRIAKLKWCFVEPDVTD